MSTETNVRRVQLKPLGVTSTKRLQKTQIQAITRLR